MSTSASPGQGGIGRRSEGVVVLQREHPVTPGARIVRAANRVGLDLPSLALDVVLVATAYLAILILRFDGAVPEDYWSAFLGYLPLALAAHVGSNWAWGLYRQMWQHASVREAKRILLAGITAIIVLAPVWYFLLDRPVPLSVALLGALIAVAMSGFVRFQSRLFASRRNDERDAGLRVLVVGAGDAGAVIIREMQRERTTGLMPVALLDDDPRKRRLALLGVPVVGAVDDLPEVVARLNVHRVILAIPSADRRLVEQVAAAAEVAEVPLKVAPRLGELLHGRASLRDVRDLNIEDVLGRQQVKTDLDAVRRLLAGKSVLITGGGGSIGAEIARQAAECDPERLVLLDNDETHLHDAVATLPGPVHSELCDVRDPSRLATAFERHRPQVVFHAAAHKHVPILQQHPCEAVQTNVLGTQYVVEASLNVGVDCFVLVSTDKAVAPTSVMGASKWLAEQLVLSVPRDAGRYCAVRFGNVLGSRGSVIPTFARQIAAGGPITVTDPRMTRYFMSIGEAVQLVLQAACFARGTDVFMLEMGEPANILDLARRMIRYAGLSVDQEIKIEVVGARPGEKLTEELRAPDEALEPTPHDAILRIEPVRIDAGNLDRTVRHLVESARRSEDGETARVLLEVSNGASDALTRDRRVLDLVEAERSLSWNQPTT